MSLPHRRGDAPNGSPPAARKLSVVGDLERYLAARSRADAFLRKCGEVLLVIERGDTRRAIDAVNELDRSSELASITQDFAASLLLFVSRRSARRRIPELAREAVERFQSTLSFVVERLPDSRPYELAIAQARLRLTGGEFAAGVAQLRANLDEMERRSTVGNQLLLDELLWEADQPVEPFRTRHGSPVYFTGSRPDENAAEPEGLSAPSWGETDLHVSLPAVSSRLIIAIRTLFERLGAVLIDEPRPTEAAHHRLTEGLPFETPDRTPEPPEPAS